MSDFTPLIDASIAAWNEPDAKNGAAILSQVIAQRLRARLISA